MELSEVIKGIDYHTWSSEDDVGDFLAALIKMHQCKNLIEVGVFRGLTTSKILNCMPSDGTYIGIDIEDHRSETVIKYMNEKKTKFILGDSLIELARLPFKSSDFIFLDGDHRYDYVKNEFKLSKKLLKHDGIICIHDYQCNGVKDWVDYISQFNGYQVLIFNTSKNRGLAVIKPIGKNNKINFWYNFIRKKLILFNLKIKNSI